MKISFSNKLILGFSAALLLILAIGIVSYNSIEKGNNNKNLVIHTYEVIENIAKVEKHMLDAETGARGFYITGLDHFLEPYNSALFYIHKEIDSLKLLTGDNAVQQARIQELEQKVDEKLQDFKVTIELRRTKGLDMVEKVVSSGKGKMMMDKIRLACKVLREDEQKLLSQREEKTATGLKSTYTILLLGNLIILLIVLLLVYFISTTFTQRKMAEDQLRHTNEELLRLDKENQLRNWVLTGADLINNSLRGKTNIKSLSEEVISALSNYTQSVVSTFYIKNLTTGHLNLMGSYGINVEKLISKEIKAETGLMGQALLTHKKLELHEIPADYLKVSTSLGETTVKSLIIQPLFVDEQAVGVIELGYMHKMPEGIDELLRLVQENIAIGINTVHSRIELQELYQESQQLAEELETQQEELRQTNEELSRQSKLLQNSEEVLKVQQEELQQNNAELEEKAKLLQEKNEDLLSAKEAISIKAKEVEQASRYKSEFLANMSHELRTPLNSVLILARLLAENKTNGLSEKQVEYANTIFKSGNDLLSLINDILDLSKIEAGRVELDIQETRLSEIEHDIYNLFNSQAKEKELEFIIRNSLPENTLLTDKTRAEQILRNLLSNAFKFTPKKGLVTLAIEPAERTDFKSLSLQQAKSVISFTVSDNGIGIPASKQTLIFEAFSQADGSTSRKYGGTGLGLSISRELAQLLGGEIEIRSAENKGSSFTLFLPSEFKGPAQINIPTEQPVAKEVTEEIEDDRRSVNLHDKKILIIEDDPAFAKILQDFAHERSYKTIVANKGDVGLQYARTYEPDAIILDMQLPVMDGWSVLKELKKDPKLKSIPVHVISAMDKEKLGLQMGAVTYLKKPVDKDLLDKAFNSIAVGEIKHKTVLIVEDSPIQNSSICTLIKNNEKNVSCFAAMSAAEAFTQLQERKFDCIILDLGLEDLPGIEVLKKIKSDPKFSLIPVIVYTGKDLSREEDMEIKKLSSAVVLKTTQSFDRLLDETNLFLHKLEETSLNEPHFSSTSKVLEEVLKNKTVLLADDDMRNVFALSHALEENGMNIITAADGKEALAKLEENKTIDIVLMDIMMPEMDGYETMREIRKNPNYRNLPILALTAKAMQGDKENCIRAGASDYISKPINTDQLLSLMRVWLYK